MGLNNKLGVYIIFGIYVIVRIKYSLYFLKHSMDSGDAFTFHYNSLFLDFNTGMQNVYTQKGMPIKNHYL